MVNQSIDQSVEHDIFKHKHTDGVGEDSFGYKKNVSQKDSIDVKRILPQDIGTCA